MTGVCERWRPRVHALHSLRSLLAGLGVLLLLAAPGAAAQPGAQIAVVTAVDGAWVRTWAGTLPVGEGERIFAADSLVIRPGFTARKSIAVVLPNGRRVRFVCPASDPCVHPFVPVDSLRSRGGVISRAGELAEAVFSLFGSNLPRYVYGLARSGPGVREAVLRLRGGAVDLSPLLAGARAGTYRVGLRPVGETAGPAGVRAPALAAVSWDPATDAPLSVPVASPGLYDVEVRTDGDPNASGARAWVLVVGDARSYVARARAFEAMRELVGGWSDAGDAEKRAFLRATLECLSRAGAGVQAGPCS